MRPALLTTLIFLTGLVTLAPAGAQEIVHALSGTVVAVNPQAKSITLNTNDGSEGVFNVTASSHPELSFDSAVRNETTPAASFNTPKAQVVLFFYGNSAVRTAIAVKTLGPGPLLTTDGTVLKVNKHEHTLMLKEANGKTATFHIAPNAVADTMDGVVPGEKFDPEKGDTLRVIAKNVPGHMTALFLRKE